MPDGNRLPWYRRGPAAAALPPGRAPENARLIGRDPSSTSEEPRVYLHRAAWDVIDAASTAYGQHEAAGLLFGSLCDDGSGPVLLIEDAVPATHGTAALGTFRFTQEDWDALHAYWRRHGGRRLAVGWFRTHPGFGTRLSSAEQIFAERHFPEWWQLTYIVDPVNLRQRIYRWHEGLLSPVPGFRVYETGEPVPADPAEAADSGSPGGAVARWPQAAALATLVGLAVWALVPGLPGSLPALREAVRRQSLEAARLEAQLEAVRDRHAALEQAVRATQTPAAAAAGATRPADPEPIVPAGSATAESTSADASPRPPAASPPSPETLTPRYVVREGDTLWAISGSLLGDPLAYPRLAEENRLENPDLILPGWELRVPAPPAAASGQEGP